MFDELMMRLCFQLAERGAGYVAPNPLVGAVLVCDQAIIGEGYHMHFGGFHAEVNAINNAIENGFEQLISKSTLYVNLEPCSHHGKTPPCSDLIIKYKIPRVVISTFDPFTAVNGRGVEKLNSAGIDVVTGVCHREGRILNRRFFMFHEKKRPYVILKFAQSADGFIAQQNPNSENRKISNSTTDRIVHKWRSEEASILIGKNTALIDDPELTVRLVKGKNPIRVVIDQSNVLPNTLKIFNREVETLILNSTKETTDGNLKFLKIESAPLIENILDRLYEQKILSVFVEGGASTLSQFIESCLWDECRVITASKKLSSGLKAPTIKGKIVDHFDSGTDTIDIYINDTKPNEWNS